MPSTLSGAGAGGESDHPPRPAAYQKPGFVVRHSTARDARPASDRRSTAVTSTSGRVLAPAPMPTPRGRKRSMLQRVPADRGQFPVHIEQRAIHLRHTEGHEPAGAHRQADLGAGSIREQPGRGKRPAARPPSLLLHLAKSALKGLLTNGLPTGGTHPSERKAHRTGATSLPRLRPSSWERTVQGRGGIADAAFPPRRRASKGPRKHRVHPLLRNPRPKSLGNARIAFTSFRLPGEAVAVAPVGAFGKPLGGEAALDLRALEVDLRHHGTGQPVRGKRIR